MFRTGDVLQGTYQPQMITFKLFQQAKAETFTPKLTCEHQPTGKPIEQRIQQQHRAKSLRDGLH